MAQGLGPIVFGLIVSLGCTPSSKAESETSKPVVPKKIPKPVMPATPADAMTLQGPLGDLVKSLSALPHDLPGPGALKSQLDLPKEVSWPLSFRNKEAWDVAVIVGSDRLNVRILLQDGTWEGPRGNSMPSGEEPKIQGIELTGPRGLVSPFPRAPVHNFQGRVMQVAKVGSYFEQGGPKSKWMVARYQGRAPFHYSESERANVEATLIALTDVLHQSKRSPTAFMAKHHGSRKSTGSDLQQWYDFGAAKIGVTDTHISLNAVDYLPIPKFFEHNGITMISTSFAHDYGDMVNAIASKDFTLHLGRYQILGRAETMGVTANAKVKTLTIILKPGQVPDTTHHRSTTGPAPQPSRR